MKSPLLQLYSFSASEINENEPRLARVMNKGYNIPRYKYGIVTSARIETTFAQGFGYTDASEVYVAFLFAPENLSNVDKDVAITDDDDGLAIKDKLRKRYQHSDLDINDFKLQVDNSIAHADSAGSLTLPRGQDFNNRFLGMICWKPHKDSYEVTGFISFYPKAGTLLLKFSDYMIHKLLKADSAWLTVIHEHELTQMYMKFGYHLVSKISVPAKSSKEDDGPLRNDILSSRDFHVDIMKKQY